MAKFNKVLSRLIPPGPAKDALKSAYYSFYYNRKHASQNGFRTYYKKGHYEFVFPDHISFKCYENISDELQRAMPGYLAKYKIKKGDTVIDCGAYIGEFTLYAAKVVGAAGRVIAFEPNPSAAKKLTENVSLNNLYNVIVIEKGIWSKEGQLKFSGGTQGGNLLAGKLPDSATPYNVSVTALDSELEKRGVTRVDFIKMDVEGAELEAIRGAEHILKNNDVDLAVASYHEVDGEKTYIKVEKIFHDLGYEAETSYPKHLTTYASKNK